MIARAFFVLLFVGAPAFAQGMLEVISLKHRTAEQVIPVLRPLLEAGGRLERPVQPESMIGTASGRLGEWLEIGGSASAASRTESGILSRRETQRSSERRVWVKVDEVGN